MMLRQIISSQSGDALAGLLAQVIEPNGPLRPAGDNHRPTPQEHLWFTSQHGFFDAASRLDGVACHAHVIVRRSDLPGRRAFEAEIAVLSALRDRLRSVDVTFYALSKEALSEISQAGLPDVRGLGLDHPRARIEATALMEPTSSRFRLRRDGRDTVLSFDAVNWARLARDFQLIAPIDATPDLHDLADLAARLPDPEPSNRHILFITPNGVGLGHLTRQMAVAHALTKTSRTPLRTTFWSYSRAATIVQQAGHDVVLRHNVEHLDAEPNAWQQRETDAFAHFVRETRPSMVITDGSRVEPFIVNALRQVGCHHPRLVWIRRGMWRADADDRGLADVRYCDEVLIPGDLSGDADPGATALPNPNDPGLSSEVITAPVVLRPPDGALRAKDARRALGLRRGTYCLVSLGGEAFARTSILHDKLSDIANKARVKLVWAQSPLASMPWEDASADIRIARYPISPYFAAFDGVISACGYNSYHELILTSDVPVLFVPTTNERLDDQAARARFAAEQGWADTLDHETGEDEDARLLAFFRSLKSKPAPTRPRGLPDGAEQMAARIEALLAKGVDHG